MASNFRTEIEAFVSENLSPEARSKALAALAISERDKLIQSGKASRTYTTTVDGHQGLKEESVRGTGGSIINYHFSFIADALEFALAFLKLRTPRVSGKLSQSWWVSINGKYIPPGVSINYKAIPADAEIVIGNTAAYWRKAEVNAAGRHQLKYKNPHELDDCVSAINREFGRSALLVKRLSDYNFPSKYQPKTSKSKSQSPVLTISEIA